jgi:hypothetical protein
MDEIYIGLTEALLAVRVAGMSIELLEDVFGDAGFSI